MLTRSPYISSIVLMYKTGISCAEKRCQVHSTISVKLYLIVFIFGLRAYFFIIRFKSKKLKHAELFFPPSVYSFGEPAPPGQEGPVS